MKKKYGREFELLIHLIERSINPSSRIEWDVKMPIISSRQLKTTQCDIVIWTGEEPRETITIIEVQDRKSKIKPNDFRGWLQKLEDVGAQHLICVSKQAFPESIKESAARHGTKVRLMTIAELPGDKIPFDCLSMSHRNFRIEKISNIKTEINPNDSIPEILKLGIHDQIFSFDKQHMLSLSDLCADYLPITKNQTVGSGVLLHSLNDTPLYQNINGNFIQIGISFEFNWVNEVMEFPISVLSYEQNSFGALAWVIEGKMEINENSFWFKIPVKKLEDKFVYDISNTIISIPPKSSVEMVFTLN